MKSGGTDRGDLSTSESTLAISQTVTPALTVGVTLQTISLDLPRNNSTVALPDGLRSIAMNVAYTHEFNPNWSGMVFANPGWFSASGGRAFAGDAFGVTTGLLARHRSSPTFSTAYGVAYDSLARSSLKVLPVFGLEWKPAEDWTIALGFPQTGVTYSVSKQLSVSLVGEGSGGSYFVDRDPLPAAAGKPSLRHARLEYYEVRTGVRVAYSFSKTASVAATAGVVMDRTFDYHAAHYKLTSRDGAGYISLAGNFGF